MKRVLFTNPDGSLSIFNPAWKDRQPGESEDEQLARAMKKAIPSTATNIQIIDKTLVPTDKSFRDAWKAGEGKIDFDMGKCREIHKGKMRLERVKRLTALDVEYLRADERGDAAAKAQIAAKKQALRDVTSDPAIASASTPEELKAVWPACLCG